MQPVDVGGDAAAELQCRVDVWSLGAILVRVMRDYEEKPTIQGYNIHYSELNIHLF